MTMHQNQSEQSWRYGYRIWNQQVQTDRTIPSKKPDIITVNNKKGTRMLIEAAIPGDKNVTKH